MARSVENQTSRRSFIKVGGAAMAAASVAAASPRAFAGENNVLRIGLIGCGGRGTGAATNALQADPNTKLVAMGDTFSDRLEGSLKNLKGTRWADRIQVADDMKFVGFDAYKSVMANCDVVILATPPHFRPMHLEAAVAAGNHIFCEKPVAVDGPGLRRAYAASKAAQEKGLSLVSGLCYRYHKPKIETMKLLHDGAAGDIVALQCSYNTRYLWYHERKPNWSDMEWQMRNWLYHTWLSGDHILEQSVHSIDKILWAMNDEMPAKATASGGRIVRTEKKWGNIYDHFNTTFEWAGGIRGFHSCRQWIKGDGDVSDFAYCNNGTVAIQSHNITGNGHPWKFKGPGGNMYVDEHIALFKSIRNGEARNNGDYMCKSTHMGLMGRTAAYTGKVVTADQILNSETSLSPARYDWVAMKTAPVPRPGKNA